MKLSKYFLPFIVLCCIGCNEANAQFKYYGIQQEVIGRARGFQEIRLAFQFVNQYRYNAGWGFEFGTSFLPGVIDNTLVFGNEAYGINVKQTKKGLPFVGLKYRLFLGNTLYLGTKLCFGLYQEKLKVLRKWGYDSASSQEIPLILDVHSVRGTKLEGMVEMGVSLALGKKVFLSIGAEIGLQRNFLKETEFGPYRTGPIYYPFGPFGMESYQSRTFRIFEGGVVGGGGNLSLGFKI